jgi:hypothetical protein
MYRLDDGGILLPEPSRASRDVLKPSQGHQSGSCAIPTARAPWGQIIHVESALEGHALCAFACMPNVTDIEEQLPPVPYVGTDGRLRKKVFDFRITFNDGSRIAVEVKPFEIAERTNLEEELCCVARAMSRNVADGVALVTDRDLDPTTRHNSRMILRYRREPDPEADAKAGELTDSLSGAVEIEAIVKTLALGHRGLGAVVRLIWQRRLQLTKHERITYKALVQPTERSR